MNNRALVVAALYGGAMMSAHAADQSVPRGTSYYPDTYHLTSVDWSGWYTGAQIGGGFGSASWTNPFAHGLSDDPNSAGILGGGQFGVNWMRNSFLLGVEADFVGLDMKGSATDGAGFTHRFSSDWLSLITARVGYAFSQYLVYAKGGAAFADERNKVLNAAGQLADSGTTTQYGWTVGGGVEYAINPNWSARIEYDFIDLPSRNIELHGPLGSQPGNVNLTIQKVVTGINYRF